MKKATTSHKTVAIRSPTIKKPRGRPFERGNAIGKGRPKGSLNKMTFLVRELLSKDAEAVTRKIVALAKKGDPVALRLVMERLCPARPGAPVEFSLPTVRSVDDMAPAYDALLQAIANGQVTPAEANQVTSVLQAASKFVAFQFGPTWHDPKALIERMREMQMEQGRDQERSEQLSSEARPEFSPRDFDD
jgi:hypothetical protein